jgi:DNA-binding response OmpR family regulator
MDAASKVLVVEDEKSLRDVLCDKLRSESIGVIEAENGKIGLELALSEHPSLILLDLLMPEVSGSQVLKKLRNDSWGKSATIIILTNVNDQERIADAVTQEAYEYLIKSDWTLEDIVAKVKEKLSLPPAIQAIA